MSTHTPNIGMTLPTGTENVSRQIINGNFTLIDDYCGTLNNQIGTFVPSKVLNGSATSYSIPNNCRATIIGISSNEAYCYMLIVSSSSGGVVHVADVYKGSSIAYDKSVSNKLTFSTNADKMLIFASSNEILNGIS